MRQKWTAVIFKLTGYIHKLKQSLLRYDIVVPTIVLGLWILVLEFFLAILSLPMYLAKDYAKDPSFFNHKGFSYIAYKVRKQVTLSAASTVLVLALAVLFYANLVSAVTLTWDGGGGDNLWSTCTNWTTDTCPTASDTVNFDGTSASNVTINATVTVNSMQILSGYTGIITQNTGSTLNVAIFSMSSTGATFTGSNNSGDDLNLNTMSLSGTNVFTSTRGTLKMTSTNSIGSGITFNHNSGTVRLLNDASAHRYFQPSAGTTFYNLTVDGNGSWGWDMLGDSNQVTVAGHLNLVDGVLVETSSPEGGRIIVDSDALDVNMTIGSSFAGGTALIEIIGSGTHTWTMESGADLPDLALNAANVTLNTTAGGLAGSIVSTTVYTGTLDLSGMPMSMSGNFLQNGGTVRLGSGSNTVTFAGTTNRVNGGAFNFGSATSTINGTFYVAGGSVTGGGGPIDVGGNLTVNGTANFQSTSGTLFMAAGFTVSGVGAVFGHNNGKITFDNACLCNQTVSVTSTFTINDVEFASTNGWTWSMGTSEYVVLGEMRRVQGTTDAATFKLHGDFYQGVNSGGGTGTVKFVGTGNQTMTGNGTNNAFTPNIVINKTGGTLTIGGGTGLDSFRIGPGSWTYLQGAVVTNSSTMHVYGDGGLNIDLASATSSMSFYNLDLSNGTVTLTGNLDVDNDILGAFALNANYNNIYIQGDWRHTGTFTATEGLVSFNATNTDQSIFGAHGWWDLTVTSTRSKTFTLPASVKQTVANALDISGHVSSTIILVSSVSSTQAQIDPQNVLYRTIDYITVVDNNNTNATAIDVASATVTNNGNNTNWNFGLPSVSSLTLAQVLDGTGAVTTAFQVSDSEGEATNLKVEYLSAANCNTYSGQSKATLSATISAANGTPTVDNGLAYQVRTVTTASGINSVTSTWSSATDVASANGTYCVFVTANDGRSDSSVVSTTLTVDNLDPAAPGSLTAGSPTAAGEVVLTFGAASSDTNFKEYLVYYQVGLFVPGQDINHSSTTDANLASVSYGGAANTTISGLNTNVQYVFNIRADDTYGNNTSAGLDLLAYSGAAVPASATLSSVEATSATVSWAANGNPAGTEYIVDITAGGVGSSGWSTATSYAFTGLTASTDYTFSIKARNGDNVETGTTTVAGTTAGTTVEAPASSSGGSGSPAGAPGSGPIDEKEPVPPNGYVNIIPVTTHNRVVDVELNATNATHFVLSEDPTFVGVSFEPYVTATKFTLSSEEGNKQVYVRYRAPSGAIYDDSDTVCLLVESSSCVGLPPLPDDSKEEPILITNPRVNVVETTTRARLINLELFAPGAVEMAISEDPAFVGISFVSFSARTTYLLTSGEGTKVVYVVFKSSTGHTAISQDTVCFLVENSTCTPIQISPPIYSGTGAGTDGGAGSGSSSGTTGGPSAPSGSGTGTGTGSGSEGISSPAITIPFPPLLSCGNSIVDNGEMCDDGNLLDGDSCDSYCATVAYWKFDENSGNAALDSSGNNNTGQIFGATYTYEVPILSNNRSNLSALQFDAKGDYITVQAGPTTNLNRFNGLVLEATVKPAQLPIPRDGVGRRLNYIMWADDDVYSMWLQSDELGNTTLGAGLNCGGTRIGLNDYFLTTPFANNLSGQFTRVGMSFYEGFLRLYINGEAVAEGYDNGVCGSRVGPLGSRNILRIGSDETAVGFSSYNREFRGLLDEVIIRGRSAGARINLATVINSCGNRFVDLGEQCDDGNLVGGDGCSAFCAVEYLNGGRCGDRTINLGEQCDDGNVVNGDGCSNICRTELSGLFCGDGSLNFPEQCDDSNQISGDGCSNICSLELSGQFCGNGVVDSPPEQCDDSNQAVGDGCSNICLVEYPLGGWCGNGSLESVEQCDDGNNINGDGCSLLCVLESKITFKLPTRATITERNTRIPEGGIFRVILNALNIVSFPDQRVTMVIDAIDSTFDDVVLMNLVINGRAYPFAYDNASRRYSVVFQSPSTVGSISSDLQIFYTDNTQETAQINIITEPFGLVVDRSTNEALSGVQIRLVPANGTTGVERSMQSRQDGSYGFLVPDGSYNIVGTRDGYRDRRPPTIVVTNGVVNGRLEMIDLPVNPNPIERSVIILSVVTEKVGDVGSTVPVVINLIKNTVVDGYTSIKEGVTNIRNDIKNPENNIQSSVRGVANETAVFAKLVVKDPVKAVGVTKEKTQTLGQEVVAIVKNVQEFAADEKVEEAAKDVVAPVATTVAALAIIPSLWGSLLALMRYLFLQPLMLLGIRKRKGWGLVYNSLNKMPVDLAIIRLVDINTNKLIQSRVTDKEGRYFFQAKPGLYRLEVIKDNFIFPSHVLKGVYTDGRRLDLYHGDTLQVEEGKKMVTPNIPIDPPEAKGKPRRIIWQQYMRGLQHGTALAGVATTGATLYVAPGVTTASFFALQIAMTLVFKRLAVPKVPKNWGSIKDNSGKPVTKAVVRLYTSEQNRLIDTQITNSKGHYAFLVGPNSYYVTVEKPGYRMKRSSEISIKGADQSFIKASLKLESDLGGKKFKKTMGAAKKSIKASKKLKKKSFPGFQPVSVTGADSPGLKGSGKKKIIK